MMISSDGITRDISAEEAVPWQPRNLDELAVGVTTLEEKLEIAKSTGYQQGYSDAVAESEKKESLHTARINELLRYLDQPLASVDETLKQSLLSLAAEMASQIVAREIGSDFEYYRAQLDQLSDKLPAQVRVTSLRLKPEKARELREIRDASDGAEGTMPEIVDDTELAGDVCLACWQESAVDISLRGRLAAIVQSYCGDNTSEALAVPIDALHSNQIAADQDLAESVPAEKESVEPAIEPVSGRQIVEQPMSAEPVDDKTADTDAPVAAADEANAGIVDQ